MQDTLAQEYDTFQVKYSKRQITIKLFWENDLEKLFSKIENVEILIH